jgi:hypothetical protein
METKMNTMMEEQKRIIETLSAITKEKDDLLPVSGYTKFNLMKYFDRNFFVNYGHNFS